MNVENGHRPRLAMRHSAIIVFILTVTMGITSACSNPASPGQSTQTPKVPGPGPTTAAPTLPGPTEQPTATGSAIFDTGAELKEAEQVIDSYWRAAWTDEFTGTYSSPNVRAPYTGSNGPLCGGDRLEPENAYYCKDGDFIIWDTDLMDALAAKGDAMVWYVLAHEWGHAIQARLDETLIKEEYELQADCLSGAILYGAAKLNLMTWEDGDENEIVAAMNDLSDKYPWTTISDHGDVFQRVTSFREGRDNGVSACLEKVR